MGYNSHLGGMRLGTKKDGSAANMGIVPVFQSKAVTYAADGTVTTAFKIPAGSEVVSLFADVTTAFNAATTNTLKVGTTSGGAELAAAASVSSAGRVSFAPLALWSNVGTDDVTVYVTYNQTGTAASAGVARVGMLYTVRNADGTAANPA